MKKYKVTSYYRYKDVQEVWAEDDEEALAISEENAAEEYDGYIEAKVEVIQEAQE